MASVYSMMDSLALENGTVVFTLTRCKIPVTTIIKDKTPAYDLTRPRFDSMLLSCGHEFHAVGMIFHWALNGNVTCPLCCKGPMSRLKIDKLPSHLRTLVEIKKLTDLYNNIPTSAFERMTPATRAEYLTPARLFTHHKMSRIRSAKPIELGVDDPQAKLSWLTAGFHEDPSVVVIKMVHDVIRLDELS